MVPNPIDLGFKLVFFGWQLATPSDTLAASIYDTKNDTRDVIATLSRWANGRCGITEKSGGIVWPLKGDRKNDPSRPTTTFTLMTGDWTEFDHHKT